MSDTIETFEFQTEARQLLDLMIHSVYSNKDIFLRELISNSSDALDKRRFEALKSPELLDEGTELRIFIDTDGDARTVSIDDNGIGMTREEVQDLIGTIAKSGTKEFINKIKQSKEESVNADLIGQFGVGFYSSFIAADRVTLVTRKAGEESATQWESTGDGTYTLEDAERDEPGTTVTLHLKEADTEDGMNDYTQEWQIRQVVKQYSDFVAYPIQMDIERKEVEKDDEGNPIEGGEEKTVVSTETLNSMKALWLRDKKDVTDEEYSEFYKHISHDWTDPASRIQAKIEGTLEYTLLLYIPGKAPMDLYYQGVRHGVHLYVKRVFIMDDCKELLPEFLRFVKGVVDSEDLSLNISREILQQDRQIERMRKGIVSKVLGFLRTQYKKDKDEFIAFWNEFGRVFKEGIFQDRENQEAILDLSLFWSTDSKEEYTTLADYIGRMKEGQDAIYYMTGESRAKIEESPHMESFLDKGYEVLILPDPVDEIWCQQVFKHKDFEFKSVSKGAVELGTEEEKKEAEEQRKEKEKEYESLLECLKGKLEEHVKEVRLSSRLTSSAACLVTDGADLTPQLEQMMKQMGQDVPTSKRILELNPDHAILDKLHGIHDGNADDPQLDDYAQLIYGQAILAEAGDLPNPGKFSKLVADLMLKAG
jgi:molecular chaperone HtpG